MNHLLDIAPMVGFVALTVFCVAAIGWFLWQFTKHSVEWVRPHARAISQFIPRASFVIGCTLIALGRGVMRHVEERQAAIPTSDANRWNFWRGYDKDNKPTPRASAENLHRYAVGGFVAGAALISIPLSRRMTAP